MKDNFKDRYDFQLRLANKSEVQELATFLAGNKWKEYEKDRKLLGKTVTKKESANFIKQEKRIITEVIGRKVMVQDYKKFNASIFVYNYIQEHAKNTVVSMTFRVLKTELGMQVLESDDAVFDLEILQNQLYHQKSVTTGSHNRPRNESIQKTIEIRNYLKQHPNENREVVCREFGFSKTTYYRVLKWLEARKN